MLAPIQNSHNNALNPDVQKRRFVLLLQPVNANLGVANTTPA